MLEKSISKHTFFSSTFKIEENKVCLEFWIYFSKNSFLVNLIIKLFQIQRRAEKRQKVKKSDFYQETLNSKHSFFYTTLKVEEKKVPLE